MTAKEDGFYGYAATTTEPGAGLLIVTVTICILMYALLPCMIAFGNQREKHRSKYTQEDPCGSKPADEEAATDLVVQSGNAQKSIHSFSDASCIILEIIQSALCASGSQRRQVAPCGQGSGVSHDTITTQSARTVLHGRRSRTQRRFRIALEKRAMLGEAGVKTRSFFYFDRVPAPAYYYPTDRQRTDNDDPSFLSKTNTHEVLVKTFTMDAQHEDFLPKQFVEDTELKITCCGTDAWWKPYWFLNYFDRVVALSEWDFEMQRITNLALPFALQALCTGLLDVATVAVIGNFLGAKAAAAYIVVDMIITLPNEFVGGFWSAMTTLCTKAAGDKQDKLCGQHVQMAMLLYVLFSLPFAFLWWAKTEAVILWFGFDEETASIGGDFARIYVFSALVEGVTESIHGLLDVIGLLENYSSVVSISQDIIDFFVILQVAIFSSPKLYHIGMIHLVVSLCFLALNISVILWKGWFKPYLPGLVGSFSLKNYEEVQLMCQTALTPSLSFLLTDCEWEILTLFASVLGPAEVTVWRIVGALWGTLEHLAEAMGDAAEARCSFLLGCGKPRHAQVSAYKSMLVTTIVSFLVTSILLTMGEDVATFLTMDPILQEMIIDLLPLFGIGNIVMTVGNVSWTLLGSQEGRHGSATAVVFCWSWLLAIPFAAISSAALELSLQGQTAAVVFGYLGSGTMNAYFLFRSDWGHDSHEDFRVPTEEEGGVEDGKKITCSAPNSSSSLRTSSTSPLNGAESLSPTAVASRMQELTTP